MGPGRSWCSGLVGGLCGLDHIKTDLRLELLPGRAHGVTPGGTLLGRQGDDLALAGVEDSLARLGVQRLDALAEQSGDRLHADTLPRLHALIEEAARDSRQLRRVLGELESSPQMLLLGRERPVPGPGEAGFSAGGGK